MEKMINLRDLLMHEVQDLTSAEEQIIEALPAMIKKANNGTLKKSLQDHLEVTEMQLQRLDQVKQLLENENGGEESNGKERKGFLGGLFGGGAHKCKGMEGLIKEGEKVMGEDMSPEVLDAAIIACAQKIEHYEICGYGTARAYARELNLGEVAELLEETLNEEYEADDLLTDLAVGKLNQQAETADGSEKSRRSSRSRSNGKSKSTGKTGSKSASRSNGSARTSKSAASKNGKAKKTASKSASSKRSSGTRTNKSSGRGQKKSTSRSSSK